MKKLAFFLLFTSISLCSVSCSKSEDANPYQGNWSGSLNGDIVGTWSAKVSASGSFKGTVVPDSESASHNYVLSGKVSDSGNLIATMKNATYNINIDFTGNFQNEACNGNWIFQGAAMEGTWVGLK